MRFCFPPFDLFSIWMARTSNLNFVNKLKVSFQIFQIFHIKKKSDISCILMRNWLGLNKFTVFFGPFFLLFLLVSSFSEISSGTGAYFQLAQRILNDYRGPGFLTVTWFGSSPTPFVTLPPTSCFSFLVLARVGEEPTYTTVRKPGLQLITKYSPHRLAGFANCAPTSGINGARP
jgi:hypothetical protein